MADELENMILFTVIVGLMNSERAEELNDISESEDARDCVVLMCPATSNPAESSLTGLVEQITFYYDDMNIRGVFTGTVLEARVEQDDNGKMNGEPLVKKILTSTGLLDAESDYSWVLVELDRLDKGHGNLIIKDSTGSVGGNMGM